MIPRYATLTLLDSTGEVAQKIKADLIEPQEVLNAFNTFYEQCIETLEKNNVLIPLIKDELDIARDKFTQKLT